MKYLMALLLVTSFIGCTTKIPTTPTMAAHDQEKLYTENKFYQAYTTENNLQIPAVIRVADQYDVSVVSINLDRKYWIIFVKGPMENKNAFEAAVLMAMQLQILD